MNNEMTLSDLQTILSEHVEMTIGAILHTGRYMATATLVTQVRGLPREFTGMDESSLEGAIVKALNAYMAARGV